MMLFYLKPDNKKNILKQTFQKNCLKPDGW